MAISPIWKETGRSFQIISTPLLAVWHS